MPLLQITVIGGPEAQALAESLLGGGALSHYRTNWDSADRFEARRLLRESETNVTAHCFVDLSQLPRVELYFADRQAQRFLLRTSSVSDPPSEIDREVLSQMVELSLQALLLPNTGSLTREEARSLLAAPAAPSPGLLSEAVPPRIEPRHLSLRASAFYALTAHSSRLPVVHGPGLGLALNCAMPAFSGAIEVRASYELPEQYRGRTVGLELSAFVLQVGGELLWVLAPHVNGSFSLGPKVAVGWDLSHLSPLKGTDDAPVQLAASRVSPSLTFNAGLVGQLPLSNHWSGFGELSLTFDPTRIEYELDLPTGTEPVIERFRARAGVLLGLRGGS